MPFGEKNEKKNEWDKKKSQEKFFILLTSAIFQTKPWSQDTLNTVQIYYLLIKYI